MRKAIEFARKHTTISDTEEQVIFLVKDTVLLDSCQAWKKNNTDDMFDVTVGLFDGTETCELVGACILFEISIIPRSNIGLYRDDGLVTVYENLQKNRES